MLSSLPDDPDSAAGHDLGSVQELVLASREVLLAIHAPRLTERPRVRIHVPDEAAALLVGLPAYGG